MSDLRLPLPLLILLGLVIGLAVLGLGRGSVASVDEAVHRLNASILDEPEREELLGIVIERAGEHLGHGAHGAHGAAAESSAPDRDHARILACAALATSDRPALDKAVAALGGTIWFRRGEAAGADVDRLSLREPAVRALLLGMLEEAAGQTASARPHYDRAVAAGRMWARPLVVELGRAGLARVD